MAKARKHGPPESANEYGEIQPIGRKGGSRAGSNKSKNKSKKKK